MKDLKLLVLKPFLIAKTNGGDICLLEQAEILQSWGVEVSATIALPQATMDSTSRVLAEMGTGADNGTYQIGSLQCRLTFDRDFHPFEFSAQAKMEEFFLSEIARVEPDIVVAHYTDFFATTAAMKWNSRRSVILLTDDEYPRSSTLSAFATVGGAYLSIQNLLVASRFMKESAKASLPWAHGYYLPNPLLNLRSTEPSTESSKKYFLFINPVEQKGVSFVLELARNMPQENFLFVGNWGRERPVQLPPNVEYRPRQDSLEKVFSVAKALLMPSVWNEAFGRVPLEAMAAGVPVIASDRGALPETIGEGGLSLPLNLEKWIAALQRSDDLKAQISRGLARVKAYQQEVECRYKALRRLLLGRAFVDTIERGK